MRRPRKDSLLAGRLRRFEGHVLDGGEVGRGMFDADTAFVVAEHHVRGHDRRFQHRQRRSQPHSAGALRQVARYLGELRQRF